MKLLALSALSFFFMHLNVTQNQGDVNLSNLFCGLPLNSSTTDIIDLIKTDSETFQVISEDEQSCGALIKNHPVLADFQGENMVMTLFHPNKKRDKRFHYGIWIDANFGQDAKVELINTFEKIKTLLEADADRIEEKDIEYYDYLEGQTLNIFLTPESKYPEIELEWYITLPGIHYIKIGHKHYTNL